MVRKPLKKLFCCNSTAFSKQVKRIAKMALLTFSNNRETRFLPMPISNKQQLNTKKKANERASYKEENILDKD